MSATPFESKELMRKGAPKGATLKGISPRNLGAEILLLEELPPGSGGGFIKSRFRIIHPGRGTGSLALASAMRMQEEEGLDGRRAIEDARFASGERTLTHLLNLNSLALGEMPREREKIRRRPKKA